MTAVHLFYPKTTVTADVHDALAASLELNLRLEAKLREVTADAMRLAEECDDLRVELQKTRDDFSSVWDSRDEVIQERERARQACNAYWHDLSRIGSLCEQSADEYPLKAVERTVREFRAAIAKRDALEDRIASMQESMSMACEEPPRNCECAGCSYSREKGGDA